MLKVKAQREGQADKATLEQIANTAALIADAASRQAAAFDEASEEVDAAQESVLKLVEEQKIAHNQLVQTLIEQVTKV
jgi:hypothetical protein